MSDSPTRFDLRLPGLTLHCGARLPSLVLRGQHLGPARDRRTLEALVATRADDPTASRRIEPPIDAAPSTPEARLDPSLPTVLVIHALTADSRVGGPGGWWSDRVGPGRPLDTTRARVLCFNNLGSCYGSSGPLQPGFPTRAQCPLRWPIWDKGLFPLPEARLPAPLSTWDQARAILRGLDGLGIDRVDLTVGGSVGGMIALALAALAPERFPALVPIATLDRATPWIIGWNHIARQLIARALAHDHDPTEALEHARQIAHMTYRAGPGLEERQGRRQLDDGPLNLQAPYRVQTYLAHQGQRLVARFDPRSYVSQLDAMDHHDLASRPPPPDPDERWTLPTGDWPGLRRLTGRMDAIGIDTDQLFFADEQRAVVARYRRLGREGSWTLVSSPHGHDGFLLPSELLDESLQTAFELAMPR